MFVRGREKCVTGDVIEREGIDDYEVSVSPSGWKKKSDGKTDKKAGRDGKKLLVVKAICRTRLGTLKSVEGLLYVWLRWRPNFWVGKGRKGLGRVEGKVDADVMPVVNKMRRCIWGRKRSLTAFLRAFWS